MWVLGLELGCQAWRKHISPLSYPTGPQPLFPSRPIWLPHKESSQASPAGYFIRDIWCGKSGLESGTDFRVWVAAVSNGLLSLHSFSSWLNAVAVLFPWDSVMKWMSYRTFSGKCKCFLFSLCSQNKGHEWSGRSQSLIGAFFFPLPCLDSSLPKWGQSCPCGPHSDRHVMGWCHSGEV